MRRGWQIAESAAFFVALVLAWEALVRLLHIKAYLLPTPSEIVVAGWERLGTLFSQTLITFYEVMLGFACALGGGILIALGIFVIPLLRRTLYPLVVAFQGTPKVALAPLIVVWILSLIHI